jgi:hypothetical protein
MLCPEVSDGGDSLQVHRVSVNKFNNQSLEPPRVVPPCGGYIVEIIAPKK